MASSQVQKLEIDVHIKASAEKFHDVFCSRTHLIAKICPDTVRSVEIQEGKWGTEGSIIVWNYTHDGKACIAKDLVESIDTKNYKTTFKVLEGDVLNYYKSFRFTVQCLPKEEGSVVHCTMEYEKLHDHIPDPHSLLQSTNVRIKDIDNHLVTQN